MPWRCDFDAGFVSNQHFDVTEQWKMSAIKVTKNFSAGGVEAWWIREIHAISSNDRSSGFIDYAIGDEL